MSGSAKAGTTAERHTCELRVLIASIVRAPPKRASGESFSLLTRDWVENRVRHAGFPRGSTRYKDSECPDHSCRMALSGLFRHCRAAFLIPNAVMQNYPDQVTEAMRIHADGIVVS